MIKILKRLVRLDKEKKKIYEEVEELIDHENGDITQNRIESYQCSPLEKNVFDQLIVMEKEKNDLLKISTPKEINGFVIIRQYMEIKSFKKLKNLQKKLLGE